MTNIRKTPLYNQLAPNRFKIESDHNLSSDAGIDTGREVLTGFGGSNMTKSGYVTLDRPARPKVPSFFDQAYYTDPKKRAKERPQS